MNWLMSWLFLTGRHWAEDWDELARIAHRQATQLAMPRHAEACAEAYAQAAHCWREAASYSRPWSPQRAFREERARIMSQHAAQWHLGYAQGGALDYQGQDRAFWQRVVDAHLRRVSCKPEVTPE